MCPRLGFALSIFAACGIHAAVLLVPRAPISAEAPTPPVVLDLAGAPVPAEGPPSTRSAPARRATAERAERKTPPVPAETVTPEVSPLSELPEQPELATAAAPVDQPVASGSAGSTAREGGGASEASPGTPPGSAGAAASGALATAALASAALATAPAVLIPPRPLAEIQPAYPRSARRAGFEGVVKVAAVVDSSGAVTSAEVLAGSGHAVLDQAALEAVWRARFAPALQEGKPAPCRIVVPIRFQLQSP